MAGLIKCMDKYFSDLNMLNNLVNLLSLLSMILLIYIILYSGVVKINDARDNSEMDSIPYFQSEAGLEVQIIEKLKENIFQVKPNHDWSGGPLIYLIVFLPLMPFASYATNSRL